MVCVEKSSHIIPKVCGFHLALADEEIAYVHHLPCFLCVRTVRNTIRKNCTYSLGVIVFLGWKLGFLCSQLLKRKNMYFY